MMQRVMNVLYKQNVLDELNDGRRRFIDDLGQLYARYGIALTFGRVMGLLLLSEEPLSLDEIAAQLEVSKSAVSVATRDLERVGLARRLGRPGSRRVLYEASDDMVPTFQAQFTRVRQSLPLFQQAARLVRQGRASQRVREMIELHEFWLAESEQIIDRWRRRKRTGR
jgi:DNA-binding transcriptional regulator GbsR (MarR family)